MTTPTYTKIEDFPESQRDRWKSIRVFISYKRLNNWGQKLTGESLLKKLKDRTRYFFYGKPTRAELEAFTPQGAKLADDLIKAARNIAPKEIDHYIKTHAPDNPDLDEDALAYQWAIQALTGWASTDEASLLKDKLESNGFQVFLDESTIIGGDDWQRTIYENIMRSDVLIVLLEEATENSDWIQREVDRARGANISILPIRIRDEIDITRVQRRLAISQTQFIDYSFHSEFASVDVDHDGDMDEDDLNSLGKAEQDEKRELHYVELVQQIVELSKRTRHEQANWWRHMRDLRREPQALTNASRKIYQPPNCGPQIHLAAGDISEMRDIDVVVNSENDYMQMARIFESNHLSSTLRHAGALIKQGRFIEDTVQNTLNTYIQAHYQYGLPIMIGEVIPTLAGHPNSQLVKNGFRYIFHVATMRVDPITILDQMAPVDTEEGLEMIVMNCLNTILQIDAQGGKPVYDTPQPPIKSIVFPIFGAGHGGRSADKVVKPMIKAMHRFLITHQGQDTLHLERIHIAAFGESLVSVVDEALQNAGFSDITT